MFEIYNTQFAVSQSRSQLSLGWFCFRVTKLLINKQEGFFCVASVNSGAYYMVIIIVGEDDDNGLRYVYIIFIITRNEVNFYF